MTAKQNTGIYAPDGSLYITPTDGAGNLLNIAGGTSTPGGSSGQVQYNNAGSLGGIARVTTDGNDVSLSGATSGATKVVASAVAGTTTVTLPAATDTLVGKATTDTLTNKTIDGGSNTLSNIANASLAHSSMTIAGHLVSLGGTQALAAADLSDGTTGTGTITLSTGPAFGSYIKTPKIAPTADSTTAIQVTKADASTVVGTWDTTNSALNLGTTAVTSSGVKLGAYSASSTAMRTVGDGFQFSWNQEIYGASPVIAQKRASGTFASPTASSGGDGISSNQFQGYDGGAFRTLGAINAFVDTVTGSNNISGYITLNTRPDGTAASNTERMRITKTGGVNIGTYTSDPGAGNLNVTGTVSNTGETVAGKITSGPNVTTTPNVDASSAATTVASGSSVILSGANHQGSYLIVLSETGVDGATGIYITGIFGSALVANAGGSTGAWVAPTTTPAAGKYSIGDDGTNIRVYNNFGSTITVRAFVVKLGTV